jgi:hypothetical protein
MHLHFNNFHFPGGGDHSQEAAGAVWGAVFGFFKGIFGLVSLKVGTVSFAFVMTQLNWSIIGDTIILTGVGAIAGLVFTFIGKQIGKLMLALLRKLVLRLRL